MTTKWKLITIYFFALALLFSSLFISHHYFMESKEDANKVARQELRINKGIFLASESQAIISVKILELILSLDDFLEKREALKDFNLEILNLFSTIEVEMQKTTLVYNEMKSAVEGDLKGARVAKLSIDLYIEEFNEFKRIIEKSKKIIMINDKNSLKEVAQDDLIRATEILKKITSTYLNEFELLSSNTRQEIFNNQYDSWQLISYSNIIFFITLTVVFVFTYFRVYKPMLKGVNIARRIADGERHLEGEIKKVDGKEVEDLVSNLYRMSRKISQHEDGLVEEKTIAQKKLKDKQDLLVTINKEIGRPLELINTVVGNLEIGREFTSFDKELISSASEDAKNLFEYLDLLSSVDNYGAETSIEKVDTREFYNHCVQNELEKSESGNVDGFVQIFPRVPDEVFVDVKLIRTITRFCVDILLSYVGERGSIKAIIDISNTLEDPTIDIRLYETQTDSLSPDEMIIGGKKLREIDERSVDIYRNIIRIIGGDLQFFINDQEEVEVIVNIPFATVDYNNLRRANSL
jgi:hypothetical protein